MNADDVDWSVFEDLPESTVTCSCSKSYRSHAKVVSQGSDLLTFTRKRCPNCGANDRILRISSDPETWTL